VEVRLDHYGPGKDSRHAVVAVVVVVVAVHTAGVGEER
jgi:hypothetical protein